MIPRIFREIFDGFIETVCPTERTFDMINQHLDGRLLWFEPKMFRLNEACDRAGRTNNCETIRSQSGSTCRQAVAEMKYEEGSTPGQPHHTHETH